MTFTQVSRPWGHYKVLASSDGWQVKELVVKPTGMLSLQSHEHRQEYWVVTQGQATVRIDDTMMLLDVGGVVHILPGVKHRLANYGAGDLKIIETQLGSYLGEDDIVRYEDQYGRAQGDLGLAGNVKS